MEQNMTPQPAPAPMVPPPAPMAAGGQPPMPSAPPAAPPYEDGGAVVTTLYSEITPDSIYKLTLSKELKNML